jgi:hypothetical protein
LYTWLNKPKAVISVSIPVTAIPLRPSPPSPQQVQQHSTAFTDTNTVKIQRGSLVYLSLESFQFLSVRKE